MTSGSTPDWRLHGVRVVRSDELDPNTPKTPGMTRVAAITASQFMYLAASAGWCQVGVNKELGSPYRL